MAHSTPAFRLWTASPEDHAWMICFTAVPTREPELLIATVVQWADTKPPLPQYPWSVSDTLDTVAVHGDDRMSRGKLQMNIYELYENDRLVVTFEAEGHVRDFGLPDTISLYGVSAKDQAEIDKHVSSAVQPPNEKRGKLYKILQEKPI